MIDSHESGTLWRDGLPGEARLQLVRGDDDETCFAINAA